MKKAKLKRELETLRGQLEDLRSELARVTERIPPKPPASGPMSGVIGSTVWFVGPRKPDLVTRDEMQKAIREATEAKDKQDGAKDRYCGECPDGDRCKNPALSMGSDPDLGPTWRCDHCGFGMFGAAPSDCPECKGRFLVSIGSYRRDYPIQPSVPSKPEDFPAEPVTPLAERCGNCGYGFSAHTESDLKYCLTWLSRFPSSQQGLSSSIPGGPGRGIEDTGPYCPTHNCWHWKDKPCGEQQPEAQPADELGAAVREAVGAMRASVFIREQEGVAEVANVERSCAARLEQAYEAHKQSDEQTLEGYREAVMGYDRNMSEALALGKELDVARERIAELEACQIGDCPFCGGLLRYGEYLGTPNAYTQLVCAKHGEVGKITRVFKIDEPKAHAARATAAPYDQNKIGFSEE